MEQSSALINILTYNLPGVITRPLFTEYNNRVKEIGDILGWEDSACKELREYESVIESLLAMSLFYRYVLGHFQAATSFYGGFFFEIQSKQDSNIEQEERMGTDV